MKTAQQSFPSLDHVWRGKLQKLCRLRFETHWLPDNAGGRAMLTALLCFGLADDSAIEDAPWCELELPLLKRRAKRMKWRDVGKLIGLTFDEWRTAKLWIMRPVDKSEAELDAWRNDQRKTKDSARKKRQREQAREQREAMLRATDRCEAVLRMLKNENLLFPGKPGVIEPPRDGAPWTYHGWAPFSRLVELAKKSRAFLRPYGRQLKNLRDAVHRALRKLAESGAVETRIEQGNRTKIMLVRSTAVAGKADTFCDGRIVASAFPTIPHKIRALVAQTTLSAGKTDTMSTPSHVDPVSTPRKAATFERRKVA